MRPGGVGGEAKKSPFFVPLPLLVFLSLGGLLVELWPQVEVVAHPI